MSEHPHCEHDNRRTRFLAKKIGTYSIAGTQPKLVGNLIDVCDDCWAKIQAASDE